MRMLISAELVVGLALFVGCSQADLPSTNAAPVTTVCPIMGHDVSENGGSTIWNGQTIGFCCEGCLPKWDKLSDEDKAAKLAAPSQTDHNHSKPES